MPKLNSAGRHFMRDISSLSTAACSRDKPPPPYSRGQVGTVQPRAAMRSSHSLLSGFLYTALRPPQIRSSSGMGVRIDGGQLSSSQARTSVRKVSSVLIQAALASRARCASMSETKSSRPSVPTTSKPSLSTSNMRWSGDRPPRTL
jgi:hypothetical protein